MGTWGADAGRRCLLIAAGLAALVVLLVGTPSPEAQAANAPATATPSGPTATPTPPFLWIVPPVSDPSARSRLYVDPLDRRFRFDYTDDSGKLVQGDSETVGSIRATDRIVTWKWSDTTRMCETATPAPAGKGPIATPTPARCPMYVWATLDRGRQQVRATLFRRTVSGRLVAQVVAQKTPLPLPTAEDPFVLLQDFQAIPKTRIIQANQQISFKNNMSISCDVIFDSIKTVGVPPADPADFLISHLGPGQISRKFPATPSPTATTTTSGNPTPAPNIWHSNDHAYTVKCDGTSTEIDGIIRIPP